MGQARRWLRIVLVIAVASQVTFTIDVVHDLTAHYVMRPFWLGDPWPSVRAITDRGLRAAGMRNGDRVLSIDGHAPEGDRDIALAIHAKKPGDFLTASAERDGHVTEYRIKLQAIQFNRSILGWLFASISWILMPCLSIALGFWVAFARPEDRRAWFMLGILLGMSMLWRPSILDPLGWPGLGVVIEAYRNLTAGLWAICMLLFGFYFPDRGRIDRTVPWLKWVLIAPIGFFTLWDVIRSAGYAVARAATEAALPPTPAGIMVAVMMISVSLFFVGLSDRKRDPALAADDRRRLGVLYFGCTAGMTPMALLMFYDLIFQHRFPGDQDDFLLVIAILMLIVFPLTMAYVVVVHRALDVRVVIRQGLQYALARRGLRVIQGVVAAAILITVVRVSQSGRVSAPGQVMVIAIGVAVIIRMRAAGERLRKWLDRRFFREAYNAEQILGELSEQVRGIFDTEALLETVTRKIRESLHVDRIAVLLQQDGAFRPALETGYSGQLNIALPAEAPAMTALRGSHQAVAADESTPPELQAQLLLPLPSKKDLLGFISLGPKKSQEPYSPSDRRLLQTVAAQTGLALENSRLTEAIAAEVAQREMLNREIEIAREVQQRLFPQKLPQIPVLEYAGNCRPARGVGGDYYDFLALSNGRLGLAVGDVSGKGIPAALLMASLQASVRGQSQSRDSDVAGLMANVNQLVFDASPENRYATFFYAQFDPATRRLIYTNGGHNAPMLLRGDEVLKLETGGPVVGLFRQSKYEQEEIQLQAGDLLILYTDGISEAENLGEEEWGEDALLATVREYRGLDPNGMIGKIMEAADAFAAGAPQHDDMTLVVARVVE